MSPRSRSQYGHGYPSRSSRGPPDPRTLDYPATLKQYAEWFRYYCPQQANEEDIADKAAENEAGDGSKPRNGIKTRWEKYKKEFLAQQVSIFQFISSFPDLQELRLRLHVWFLIFNLMAETIVLYRSFKLCLTITESLPGLRRSMIRLQNLLISGKGFGEWDGGVD